MEEIKLTPEDLSYTHEKWLAGHPEPEFKNWGLISKDGLGKNMEYSQIQKAKNYTFYTALEFTLITMKKVYTEKLSSIIPERREMYRAELLKDAEGKYSGYGLRELIDRWHKNKFEKVDGFKYQQVKGQQDRLRSGEYSYSAIQINDFHTAVLNFELAEFLRGNESKPEVVAEETAPPERRETNAVKYKLLDLFFKGTPEYKDLKIKDQEHILGFILGCSADTAKDIKNEATKSKPDGRYINKITMDRFTELLDKIKKGELT
jgi:hypothetical protein